MQSYYRKEEYLVKEDTRYPIKLREAWFSGDGKLLWTNNYFDGQKHGVHRIYKRGATRDYEEETYHYGKRHGTSTKWVKNKQVVIFYIKDIWFGAFSFPVGPTFSARKWFQIFVDYVLNRYRPSCRRYKTYIPKYTEADMVQSKFYKVGINAGETHGQLINRMLAHNGVDFKWENRMARIFNMMRLLIRVFRLLYARNIVAIIRHS